MEPSIEELISQALRDGNTPAAAALARTMEERTRLATLHYSQLSGHVTPQQQAYFPQPTAIPVQAQTVGRVVKNNKNEKFNLIKFLFSWKMTAIALYIAIAEVSAPGHQGPLKAHEMHWFWLPRMAVGFVGVKLPEFNNVSSGEAEVAGEVEVSVEGPQEEAAVTADSIIAPQQVMVQCDGSKAAFNIADVKFTLFNIEGCNRGILKQGQAIASVTPDTYVSTNDGQVEQNFTPDDLREAGLMK